MVPDRRNRHKACSQILQHRIFPALAGHQDSTSSACSPCISPVCLYLPNLPAEAGNTLSGLCAGVWAAPPSVHWAFSLAAPRQARWVSLPCGWTSFSFAVFLRLACWTLSRLSSSPLSGGESSEALASLLARGKVASPAIVLGSAWSSARRCFFPWLSSSGALEESVPLRRVAFRFPRHSARIFLRTFHACCNWSGDRMAYALFSSAILGIHWSTSSPTP